MIKVVLSQIELMQDVLLLGSAASAATAWISTAVQALSARWWCLRHGLRSWSAVTRRVSVDCLRLISVDRSVSIRNRRILLLVSSSFDKRWFSAHDRCLRFLVFELNDADIQLFEVFVFGRHAGGDLRFEVNEIRNATNDLA